MILRFNSFLHLHDWKGTVSNMQIEKERIVKQRVVDMKKYRDVT